MAKRDVDRHAQSRSLRDRGPRRRDAAPVDDDDRRGRRTRQLEPGRTLDRVSASATSRSTSRTTRPGWSVIPAAGGQPRTLTDALDRPVSGAVWSSGRQESALRRRRRSLAADRTRAGQRRRASNASRMDAASSPGSRRVPIRRSRSCRRRRPTLPEVHALENGRLRKLTTHNDAWLKGVLLGTTEEFTSTSSDKTEVHGLIVKPPTFTAGPALSGAPSHSRRAERAGRALVQLRTGVVRGDTATSSSP